MANDRIATNIGNGFKRLASIIEGEEAVVEVAAYTEACATLVPVFGHLGFAWRFAEMDYVAKVEDLVAASNTILTVEAMVDLDMAAGTVRTVNSHTRNLLRVKRSLEFTKVLCEEVLATEGNSLVDPVSKAYAHAFAPYNGWGIRKAVGAALYALPYKDDLVRAFDVDENTVNTQMKNYATASAIVINYTDTLFLSRNLEIDW